MYDFGFWLVLQLFALGRLFFEIELRFESSLSSLFLFLFLEVEIQVFRTFRLEMEFSSSPLKSDLNNDLDNQKYDQPFLHFIIMIMIDWLFNKSGTTGISYKLNELDGIYTGIIIVVGSQLCFLAILHSTIKSICPFIGWTYFVFYIRPSQSCIPSNR